MTQNFEVYQTVLPTLQVWRITSAAEVDEAFNLIQHSEHTFHRREHSYRDGESWPWVDAQTKLLLREGEIYTEWWQNEYGNSQSRHERTWLRPGNTIVLSSNGKAVILGDHLPEVVRASDLPAFITAPELRPL